MKIINKTRNVVLAGEALMADTPFSRMKGLLGKRGLGPDEALILKPSNSIHTFFMRFPIDVLFVDKEGRLIKAISAMKPFRLTRLYYRAVLVVELGAGIIRSTATSGGDLIMIE
jgi:uncharacterized membrane protein (UPF0127 family)